jgi:hypothetical protein
VGTVYAFPALSGDFALSPAQGSSRVTPSAVEAFVIHLHVANAFAIGLIGAAIAPSLARSLVARRVA